ncbi:unnamed protein product [Cylicostephanus goldi]|uniref:Uncharacterized protein n=1 Tax=Cylicostephanus goldi TaxID=71465 RepID=A0A3P7QP25_CYLGO|nr:unnamed protein product [Cylicostephanus goldi]
MADLDSDYHSSDDEDYVPEEGVEDVDYPSGEEEDEVNEDSGKSSTKRKRAGKDKPPESTEEPSTSTEGNVEDDAKAAFLALMSEDDPILGRKRAEVVQSSSESPKSKGRFGRERCYRLYLITHDKY